MKKTIKSMQLNLIIPALSWSQDISPTPLLQKSNLTGLNKIFTYAVQKTTTDRSLSLFLQQHLPAYNEIEYFRQTGSIPNKTGQLLVCPINLQVHLSHISLNDSKTLAITAEEARILTEDISSFLHNEEYLFTAITPTLWVMTPPKLLDTQFPSPYDLQRDKIQQQIEYLGKDDQQLEKMISEIQTFLFTHPINQKREQNGFPTINSLWIYPANSKSSLEDDQINKTQFYTDHPIWQNQFNTQPLPTNIETWYKIAQQSTKTDHTMLLDSLYMPVRYQDTFSYQQALTKLDTDFFMPIYTLIKSRKISQLNIYSHGAFNGTMNLTRADLLHFWKKKKKFNGYITQK